MTSPTSSAGGFPTAEMLIFRLQGRTILTLGRDKPNTILSILGANVIVGTLKSPKGKPVPLGLVQRGLDILQSTGEFLVRPESLDGRRRSSFVGAAIATLPNVAVEHRPVLRLMLIEAAGATTAANSGSTGSGYPDPEVSRAVDAAGARVAMRAIVRRFASLRVIEMPHNHPGYDAKAIDEVTRIEQAYVEIKSTAGPVPSFFMSENERRFAADHAGRYHLIVVTNVDTQAVTGDVRWHDGPLTEASVELLPKQWKGRLI